MTKIVWDQLGDRRYEVGVNRGVLFLPDNSGVAWNGLTAIEEQPDDACTSYYNDGVKYLDSEHIGDFTGILRAFTYPPEFEQFIGIGEYGEGMFVQDQRAKSFGLSYQTRIGNDTEGTDHGHKLHILYNLVAVSDARGYTTIGDAPEPMIFGWTLVGTPIVVPGFRPTVHVIIDSNESDIGFIESIEAILYGSDIIAPRLPTLSEIINLGEAWIYIEIVDNGDGTWTATGPDHLITMIDSTTFRIRLANATFSDTNTYQISSTEL